MSTPTERLAEELRQRTGISTDAANLLLNIAASEIGSIRSGDFTDEGLESVLWLLHRGLVKTDACMGVLHIDLTPYGSNEIVLARMAARRPRKSQPAATSRLVPPGVHTTNG